MGKTIIQLIALLLVCSCGSHNNATVNHNNRYHQVLDPSNVYGVCDDMTITCFTTEKSVQKWLIDSPSYRRELILFEPKVIDSNGIDSISYKWKTTTVALRWGESDINIKRVNDAGNDREYIIPIDLLDHGYGITEHETKVPHNNKDAKTQLLGISDTSLLIGYGVSRQRFKSFILIDKFSCSIIGNAL